MAYGPGVSIEVRPARPSQWETWRDLRLRALTDAPAAFAETHAQAIARGDAEWRALVAPRPDAVIAHLDELPGTLARLAAGRRSPTCYSRAADVVRRPTASS